MKRWSQEYLKALRETHNMRRKSTLHKSVKLGHVVFIKGMIRIAEGGIWELEYSEIYSSKRRTKRLEPLNYELGKVN